ncbi:MAG: hypothetical protein M3Y84_05280 [Acidobacteriota bacterium]|nr:hypothetical protein [Acidobacteriota bacterium]
MHKLFARSTLVIVLGQQLLSPTFVFSQQETRPRRSQTQVQPEKTSSPTSGEWKIPATPAAVSLDQSSAASSSKHEPTIRVALATDARRATVSTSGHLMNANEQGTTLVAMDVARVRVEPRFLSPRAAVPFANSEALYQLEITGLPTRGDAEQESRDIR